MCNKSKIQKREVAISKQSNGNNDNGDDDENKMRQLTLSVGF
jgi:hypothetical protein